MLCELQKIQAQTMEAIKLCNPAANKFFWLNTSDFQIFY